VERIEKGKGSDRLITAEGNAGNMNTAMVMDRPRNENIRAYIRIPDRYRANSRFARSGRVEQNGELLLPCVAVLFI